MNYFSLQKCVMYKKIVNHYKKYLKTLTTNPQNDSETGTDEEPAEQNAQPEAVPGPSGVHLENSEPIPGPSRVHQEDVGPLLHQQVETEKRINFVPSFSAVKVFENNEIEVFVQKSLHKRLTTFKMQDSVFNVKVKVKNNGSPPLIKDLLMVLENAFVFILSNIRTFFQPDEENIVYMTLIQSPMVNGLNSAGFHLQDN